MSDLSKSETTDWTAEEVRVAQAIYAAFPNWREYYEAVEPGSYAHIRKRENLPWDHPEAKARHQPCLETARVAINTLRRCVDGE